MTKRSPGEMAYPALSTFLSGTACACGTASTALTIPAGATSAWIHAEGGSVYWSINAASAAATSGGYVPADATGYIPPIDNLGTVCVIGSGTAVVAHVEFYQE